MCVFEEGEGEEVVLPRVGSPQANFCLFSHGGLLMELWPWDRGHGPPKLRLGLHGVTLWENSSFSVERPPPSSPANFGHLQKTHLGRGDLASGAPRPTQQTHPPTPTP